MQHLRMIIVDSVAAVVSPILGGQQIHGNNILLEINLFRLKHYTGNGPEASVKGQPLCPSYSVLTTNKQLTVTTHK